METMSLQIDTLFFLSDSGAVSQNVKIDSALINQDAQINQDTIISKLSSKKETLKNVSLTNRALPDHPMKASGNEWVFGVLIIVLFLFISVRLVFNKYITNVFQAVLNQQTSSRMFREKNYKFFHGAHRLNLIFYLTGGLFAYQYLSYESVSMVSGSFLRGYSICFGMLLGYFILKFSVLLGLGALVDRKNEFSEYVFNITIYNKVLGLILGVVTFCIAFLPVQVKNIWLITGLGTVMIIYLLSLIRGALIFIKRHFSIFYMILYLCTLEILPLLLIFKFILD